MWIAKFRNWHKTCLIRPLCVKYKVTDMVYMINSWSEKEQFYYTELHLLQGSEENKKQFIKDMRKDPATIKVEIKGDHIFTLNKIKGSTDIYAPVFNQKLIYIKPVIQHTDGYETWEVACWDKESLMKIMKIPDFNMKLTSIEEKPLGEIFLPQIQPKLSRKQKETIELAVKEGYYRNPRKITLQKLAEITKIKKQTLQEHLTRAENKLIPFLTEKI
jgi:predicted DNA binding protein